MAQILVVDDDEAIRSMLAFALSDEGYDVVTAKNGIEAFEQILRASISLVLLDVEMPVMDGISLAQSVREQGVHVPIVFMSAGDRALQAAQAAQAAGYLVKPFNLETLYSLIARIARS